MKFLAVLLIALLPSLAMADMGGFDIGFGENSKPSYGFDYQFGSGLPYLDVAFMANSEYVQPYVSGGLQFEHINVGLATAVTLSNMSNGAFQGQLSVGPEVGYMQNLSKLTYVKASVNYMGFNGPYVLGSTLGLGLNF